MSRVWGRLLSVATYGLRGFRSLGGQGRRVFRFFGFRASGFEGLNFETQGFRSLRVFRACVDERLNPKP